VTPAEHLTADLTTELQGLGAEQRVPASVLAPRPMSLLGLDTHTFDSVPWRLYRKAFGCSWDQAGTFAGVLNLNPVGDGLYKYIPDAADPFRFTRASGATITPGKMLTDCGSVPRVVWSIPMLNPWTYVYGYLLHDWLFTSHHCNLPGASEFHDANRVLGEAIFTQMTAAQPPYAAPEDWRAAVTIFEAVNSFVGRRVWDRAWTPEEQFAALNP